MSPIIRSSDQPYIRSRSPSCLINPGALFNTLVFGLAPGAAAHLKKFRDTPHEIINKQRLSWQALRVPLTESSSLGEPLRYYRTTGLILTQMQELVRRVKEALHEPWNKPTGKPKSLGLYQSVEAACMYLRQNVTQEFIGDTRDTSQPTISRYVARLVPIVKAMLEEFVPSAEEAIEIVKGRVVLVDGTLAVSIRKSRERRAGIARATRWRVVHDLRLLRVFAVLRDGCGWRCPSSGGY